MLLLEFEPRSPVYTWDLYHLITWKREGENSQQPKHIELKNSINAYIFRAYHNHNASLFIQVLFVPKLKFEALAW